MNKPVLFLDFDGPLFPENIVQVGRPIEEYPGKLGLHPFISYWEMSNTSVHQLNALYKIYQFDTVVSSTWKDFVTKEQVEELFSVNGLKLHLHDVWSTSIHPMRRSSYRVNEISWWLDEQTVTINDIKACPAHIILDDPWSGSTLEDDGWRLFGLQQPHIIDPNVGIDDLTFKSMRSIVTSWDTDYESREFIRTFPQRKI